MVAVDPRIAILHLLRNATEAYGADMPLPSAGRLRLPAAATPPAPAVARNERPATPPPTRQEPRPATVVAAPPVAIEIDLPADLDALRDLALACRKCRLCEGRTKVVFGEGAPRARVMFVGEAPGAREDESGRPFVGPAGQLLTRMIENAMGMRREDVFIANVNKCRPPNNRDPQPDEVAACLPFLRAQIRAVRPEVIVTLGRVATHNLLGTELPMGQLRTRELRYENIPVVATWHPAYLLRQPDAKRDTWEDIKRVNRLLGNPEIPPRPDVRS